MRFESVHIAAVAHDLPPADPGQGFLAAKVGGRVTSLDVEAELADLYARLRLHPGRIELMSGIRERRFYAAGTRPSEIATRAGARALAQARDLGITREHLGQLVFSAVCRDFLEPATASVVHHALELEHRAPRFDLSNACLGFADGMVLAANLIETGVIPAALVVAGEDGGPLVRETVRHLVEGEASRKDLKRAIASLTIGSGGAAMVLAHRSLFDMDQADLPPRLWGANRRAATEHNVLCQGDTNGSAGPLMETDSEALLVAGVALARETWSDFQASTGWTADDVERVITHQVGSAHRRALLDGLGLETARDFPTVETLGNIGSVSLPLTYALSIEDEPERSGARTALLGIGSGLNCAMLAVQR